MYTIGAQPWYGNARGMHDVSLPLVLEDPRTETFSKIINKTRYGKCHPSVPAPCFARAPLRGQITSSAEKRNSAQTKSNSNPVAGRTQLNGSRFTYDYWKVVQYTHGSRGCRTSPLLPAAISRARRLILLRPMPAVVV